MSGLGCVGSFARLIGGMVARVTVVALGVRVGFFTILGNFEHCPLFATAWHRSG